MARPKTATRPDKTGHFGPYGGRFVPETLMAPLDELTAAYEKHRRKRRFRDRLESLLSAFPAMPAWPAGDRLHKLSAAWMIEHCGLKGARQGDAVVSEQHALVLVNLGGASGRDVAALAGKVGNIVHDRFGIRLEPEIRVVEFQI